ncbi:MAG: bifunctional demethylmenaquinone methyltransferase/2-methoxy-6-polyprenyl-1,4-benzoquinol methylase UbiE [Haliangiales bacterium]
MSELSSNPHSTAPSGDGRALVKPGSGQMFDGIASRYDLLNRLMSFGLDRRWRKKTVAALALGPGGRVLDLATGTADIALTVARKYPDCQVVGVDPSTRMLDVGRQKVADKGLTERVTLEVGDAQALPYGDGEFDGVTIAFGIRNVPDRARALAEMARVTRPGGRVAILELSEPRRGLLAPLARFHIHRMIPSMGAWLSGSKEYRYLQTSIAAFPPPEEFAALMRAQGLCDVSITPFSFGVCHLYVGARPEVTA